MKTIDRRTRVGLIGLVVGGLMALGACGPQPSTPDPDPTTPWLAAGCLDSTLDYAPDAHFSGVANTVGNIWGFAADPEDLNTMSTDGTCTGEIVEVQTMVRANSAAAAIAACTGLDAPVVNPPRMADWGYDVPVDAWLCIEGPPEATTLD